MKGKLDTGADSSSVYGRDVKVYKKSGKDDWVTFRLRGKGGSGDLLVTAVVAVPEALSEDQKAAVEAFAAASDDSPRTHLGV